MYGVLEYVWRADVEQADITPLMSPLLGSNVPANSEGKLPLNYVDMPHEHAARAVVANALEVLEVYRVKHEQRKGRMLHYVPYGGLPASASHPDSPGADLDTLRRLSRNLIPTPTPSNVEQ